MRAIGHRLFRLGSPVSDDGRGLKPNSELGSAGAGGVRPSVMTGVD